MKLPRFQNHVVINTLRSLGHKVKIWHIRQWFPVYDCCQKRFAPNVNVTWRVSNGGGKTIVSILTADGVEYIGEAKNPIDNQYNKNFGVHVALDRAILKMNEANDREDDNYFDPVRDFVGVI